MIYIVFFRPRGIPPSSHLAPPLITSVILSQITESFLNLLNIAKQVDITHVAPAAYIYSLEWLMGICEKLILLFMPQLYACWPLINCFISAITRFLTFFYSMIKSYNYFNSNKNCIFCSINWFVRKFRPWSSNKLMRNFR